MAGGGWLGRGGISRTLVAASVIILSVGMVALIFSGGRGGGEVVLKQKMDGKKDKVEEKEFLNHLSSSRLVQRAAADCAQDPQCVPSVDELVQRAARACAKDAACVCDWGRYPRKCFLSEVARHKALVKDAKALEAVIREKEEVKGDKLQLERRINREEEKFTQEVVNGGRAVDDNDVAEAKRDLTQAEYYHQLSERLTGSKNPSQLSDLHALARHIVDLERGRDDGPAGDHGQDEHGRAARGRHDGERSGEARTQGLRGLSQDVSKLVSQVGQMEHRRVRESPQAFPHRGSTRSEIRNLAHEVAALTGKVSELEHTREWQGGHRTVSQAPRRRAARTEDLSQVASPSVSQEEQVERERARVLSHQEVMLASAISRGKAALSHGHLVEARSNLSQAKYYHEAMAKLRGMPAGSKCERCDSLSSAVEQQVKLASPPSATKLDEDRDDTVERHIDGSPKHFKNDEKRFDHALKRGEVYLLAHKMRAARDELERSRDVLERLDREGKGHHEGLALHEMRKAAEGLADRIEEGTRGLEKGSSSRNGDGARKDSTRSDDDELHVNHDQQKLARHSRGRDDHGGSSRQKSQSLRSTSEQLDADVQQGEKDLAGGRVGEARAKLRAARRISKKILASAGVDYQQDAIPSQLHELAARIRRITDSRESPESRHSARATSERQHHLKHKHHFKPFSMRAARRAMGDDEVSRIEQHFKSA